jgi:acyl-CoA synthetase (AMP-forming)/AMP-acid ligase II
VSKSMRPVVGPSAGSQGEAALPESLTISLGELAGAVKDGLLAFSVGVGLEVLQLLMEEDVTALAGVKGRHDPARRAVRHGYEDGSVTLGGLALGIPFAIVYAQTEASPVITGTRITDQPEDQAETVGQPFPQTEVKIVDPVTQQTVPLGQVGEICTRGYHVMSGYFDNPEGTAQAIDPQGWLHTGDLGSMDERGYCRVEGRVKEMIIRGGENIYPREIEMVLLEHAGVAEVAVVGVPDEWWGEQVAAFIRPAADAEPATAELEAFCHQRLAPFKVPRFWLMVDAFPMTASGKVQKFALRERFVAAAPQAPAGTG